MNRNRTLTLFLLAIFMLSGLKVFAQTKRKVVCIGETVMDIVFRGAKPISANAGGSALNSAVSLGRSGMPVSFIGEVGNDSTGLHIQEFLRKEHVDAWLTVRQGMRTTISTAYLDEENNAHYTFFMDKPVAGRRFHLPEINKDDIVLFGSFFAVNPANSSVISAVLDSAKAKGAIVYYDINLRKPHAGMLSRLMPSIESHIETADIVRGSRGDIRTVFGSRDIDSVYNNVIAPRCENFICTRGAEPVSVYAHKKFSATYAVPQIKTVSTIAAGDNFNAGFCYGLLKLGITRDMLLKGLTAKQWKQLIDYAQQFSQDCCKHLDNYISKDLITSKK